MKKCWEIPEINELDLRETAGGGLVNGYDSWLPTGDEDCDCGS